MALFDEDELAAYLQVPSVNGDTFDLLLELAESEIESETGDLAALTTAQTATARSVAFEVVARAYRNPNGLIEFSIDDFRGKQDASAVGIYLTAAERARLRRLLAATDDATTGSVALRPTWRSW